MARAFTGDSIPRSLGRAFDYGTYRLARARPATNRRIIGGSRHRRLWDDDRGRGGQEMLTAAAERFGVRAAECKAINSRVVHEASGRARPRGTGRIRGEASVPSRPALKDPATYSIRRTARPRPDIRTKVDGSAIYGSISARQALCAAVEMAPVSGGKLLSVDSGPAESMPGVKRVRAAGERRRRRRRHLLARARKALAAIEPQV